MWWFSPASNLGSSVQCLSLSRINQSRAESQRWDGGGRGRGVMGLGLPGVCRKVRHVSYHYRTCGGSPWPLQAVSELELLGPQEGQKPSVRNVERFPCAWQGNARVSLHPALRESRGSLTLVGSAMREKRAWRNARHYAHCPLAAESHLLFRSMGSISQK